VFVLGLAGLRWWVVRAHRRVRSLRVYLIASGEGVSILGQFSYLGALLADRHALGPLGVGLSLSAFGVAAMIFGRASGRIVGRVDGVNLNVDVLTSSPVPTHRPSVSSDVQGKHRQTRVRTDIERGIMAGSYPVCFSTAS
jgi:hypothetical protein